MYNKVDLLRLIVAPQLCGGWQHNYLTKTRQMGLANEQSTYYLMSMIKTSLYCMRNAQGDQNGQFFAN